MPQSTVLRHAAEVYPAQPEPLLAPTFRRPVLVPLPVREPTDWVIASFAIASSKPLTLMQEGGIVLQTQDIQSPELRFKPDAISDQFQANIERALARIRDKIEGEFRHILMLDAAAADAGLDEKRRPTPRSTQVGVTVYSKTDAMADLRRAKLEVAPARQISVNFPVTLRLDKFQARLDVFMEKTRQALSRESGLRL